MDLRRVLLPSRRDVEQAAVLAAAVLAGSAVVAYLQPDGALGPFTVAAVLVGGAAWAWHRVAPVVSAAVVTGVVAAYVLAGQPYGPIMVLVVVACFAVARYRGHRAATLTCAVSAVALAAALWTRLDATHLEATAAILLAWPGVFVAVPALAGALVRTRAEAAARERAELLARGADEERLRVAREVHDIAGHGFAVVAMQAGVALTVFEEQPRQARISLEAIRTSSEQALRELQAVLDTLHGDGPVAREVPELVDRVRAGGLPVALTVTGDPDGLEQQVSATIYRLVQEALTNVVRHAGPAEAEVVIEYRRDVVSVAVRDSGPGHQGTAGRGLRGLRERVEGLDGTFVAGDRSDGGYAVAATIPTRGAAR
jgi:signal transduction histidine kinase